MSGQFIRRMLGEEWRGLVNYAVVKRRANVGDHTLADVAHEIRREIFGQPFRQRQTYQQNRDRSKINTTDPGEILAERKPRKHAALALVARDCVEDRFK